MRIMTSTNCQISPIVMQSSSAFASGTLPSPESRSARAGATSHASAAIGRAAAAQTPTTCQIEYCGMRTPVASAGRVVP
jgi:hypothetical protein